MKIFNFLLFSDLTPSKSQCHITGIGTLEGVSMALCEAECMNLSARAIKTLVLMVLTKYIINI